MRKLKPGDKVQITDTTHPRYGQIGVIEHLADNGSPVVRHEDGELVYHPWGYDVVRHPTDVLLRAQLRIALDRETELRDTLREFLEAYNTDSQESHAADMIGDIHACLERLGYPVDEWIRQAKARGEQDA